MCARKHTTNKLNAHGSYLVEGILYIRHLYMYRGMVYLSPVADIYVCKRMHQVLCVDLPSSYFTGMCCMLALIHYAFLLVRSSTTCMTIVIHELHYTKLLDEVHLPSGGTPP